MQIEGMLDCRNDAMCRNVGLLCAEACERSGICCIRPCVTGPGAIGSPNIIWFLCTLGALRNALGRILYEPGKKQRIAALL